MLGDTFRTEVIMEEKSILVFSILLATEITACSSNSREDAIFTETFSEPEYENEKATDTDFE